MPAPTRTRRRNSSTTESGTSPISFSSATPSSPDGSDLAPVRAAAEDVFAARATEAVRLGHTPRQWPPVVVANDVWQATWHISADQAGLTQTLDEAITSVNKWIEHITKARTTPPTPAR